MTIITKATLTCPKCGHHQQSEMPTDACQFFYECLSCQAVLRPLDGDCCVYCSFADQLCPAKQQEAAEANPDGEVSRNVVG